MKLETKSPCASCPYRKDAPLKLWHREEFENLLAQDELPLEGATFGCHKYRHRPREEQTFCAGWLLDQQRRGYPSIQLRLHFSITGVTAEQLDEVTDGGHELYPTMEEMCMANGARGPKMRPVKRLPVFHVKRSKT